MHNVVRACSRFLVALGLLSAATLAQAAELPPAQAATEQVRARLLASVDAVYPGEEILLGLEQKIIAHWHTYWINPGDSGLATRIAWTLPPGARAGEIQWPLPSRYTLGTVTNYGYADEVTLLSSLRVPADAVVGGSVPVRAKVNWLVCAEVCIPQQVELGLSLPVVAAGSARSAADGAQIQSAQARLPVMSPWPIEAHANEGALALQIGGALPKAAELWFYADDWGKVVHGAAQTRHDEAGATRLVLQPGDAAAQPGETLRGVLVLSEPGVAPRGYVVSTPVIAAPGTLPEGATGTEAGRAVQDTSLVSALLLAFLGGLLLNLMPCVFPVLSFKALSLLQHSHLPAVQKRLQAWVYTLGILASFALLGVLLVVLKAGGAQIGWGFQFQSPPFVTAVAYLLFAVGLSLSGVFTIGNSVTGAGSALADKPGYAGSFFTGVLAVIVATPCTAPFMGAALGYALTQPAVVLLAVLLSLGFGLALPYLLLAHWPGLQRHLPRPGLWMERVKQVLAFPMYAAAIWLVWVLAQQAGATAVAAVLGGMLAIALAAWIFDSSRNSRPRWRRAGSALATASIVFALFGGYVAVGAAAAADAAGARPQAAAGAGDTARHWQPYSAETLQALRADGKPVFLNFTAAWCISCLVNERVALSHSKVIDAFGKAGITYLKGDWTDQDPQIAHVLAQFGRSGVPLYVFYPSGRDSGSVVLPQILTPEIVLTTIAAATSP